VSVKTSIANAVTALHDAVADLDVVAFSVIPEVTVRVVLSRKSFHEQESMAYERWRGILRAYPTARVKFNVDYNALEDP
jgi:hypothetical protein